MSFGSGPLGLDFTFLREFHFTGNTSSIKNGDALSLAGSIIFLIACGVFVISLAKKKKQR